MDLSAYRATAREKERVADLMSLVPLGLESALDLGARDGHLACELARRVALVTALDLTLPQIDHPAVTPVRGDATALQFPDASFDLVLCAEVLEHIPSPALERACAEIVRVSRRFALIGVPYRQDIRFGRTTCRSCGTRNPPYAHINAFDERRLHRLFLGMSAERSTLVGTTRNRTNRLSVLLNDLAGNPWGTYGQEEPCIQCNAMLQGPVKIGLLQRTAVSLAHRINQVQQSLAGDRPNWIHILFTKAGC